MLSAVIALVRDAMRPGATVADLDALAGEVLGDRGLGDYHVPLPEGMTVTIGHTILAIPGVGGVRHEDVCRVTPTGGELLAPYPIDPIVAA